MTARDKTPLSNHSSRLRPEGRSLVGVSPKPIQFYRGVQNAAGCTTQGKVVMETIPQQGTFQQFLSRRFPILLQAGVA